MANEHQKFIIQADRIFLGDCEYHSDLAMQSAHIKSGGFFEFDAERGYTFFGMAHGFGMAKFEDIKRCIYENMVFSNNPLKGSIAQKHKFRYRYLNGDVVDLN